ncbi:CoA transferase [Azospirillum sp. HJ39]|uniref:CaiB/BaiF CoA transferase family protein n=1 Tax=Azospirillum sp. HJ39 TaxID=3159496 RepID=UPI00355904A1
MAGALSGLKVLDLSRFIAGPHCAMQLGDLGADVVKVERTRLGDDTRSLGPYIEGESIYFMMYNRNKRSLTLNFRNPAAQDLLRRLVAETDILIENFRPGTMEKMGCGWDVLRSINPRLIMARISGYGQGNALSGNPCFDGIAQATCGLMDLTGQPDGAPSMAGTFVVDYASALYAAVGILAAVEQRHRTGVGQVVDVSLMGSATSLLMTAIPDHLVRGHQATRLGNRDRYAAPGNSFKAGDGVWVHMVAGNDAHFPRFVGMIGRPGLLADPRFATLEARMANVDAIEAIAAEWIGARSSDEVLQALHRAELPCARVQTVADVATSPYMREAGHVVDTVHPRAGVVPMQGLPIRLSETPAGIRMAAPVLGAHSGEVLADWLGMAPADIEAARGAGIV